MSSITSFFQSGIQALIIWVAFAFHALPTWLTPPHSGGFWHTSGNQILTVDNKPIRIAGINWYGLETSQAVLGGLDSQDYKVILRSVRANGYNTLRIPFANAIVESPVIPENVRFSSPNGPINTDLRNQTSLQILDHVIEYAGTLGLKIILDNHRSDAGSSGQENGLWYSSAYPEAAWIADWQFLAKRYRKDATVIGMDLRNEPHDAAGSGACWDCGGARDWHLAAQRAGNAILEINPHVLIFVEGVDSYKNDFYWWGGNLQGVRNSPVNLKVAHQLVYSAHDYGPVEYSQPWFNEATTSASLEAMWSKQWAYISQQNIAPVWLGEFGTTNSARDIEAYAPVPGSQAQWFQSLTQFLAQDTHLNWSYWALNQDSQYSLLDTTNAARPVSGLKQQILSTMQTAPTYDANAQPAPHLGLTRRIEFSAQEPVQTQASTQMQVIPQPTTQPAARIVNASWAAIGNEIPAPTTTAPGACHIHYRKVDSWKHGFTASIEIENTGRAPINGWTLRWHFNAPQSGDLQDPNAHISESWDSVVNQSNSLTILQNGTRNSAIPAGGTISGIGFNATFHGTTPTPGRFYLNNVPCD